MVQTQVIVHTIQQNGHTETSLELSQIIYCLQLKKVESLDKTCRLKKALNAKKGSYITDSRSPWNYLPDKKKSLEIVT